MATTRLSRVKDHCTVDIDVEQNGTCRIKASGIVPQKVQTAIQQLQGTRLSPDWVMNQIMKNI